MRTFKRYGLLLLPITYIIYLLYVRIFLTRAPRDLVLFPHLLTAIITTVIILIFLIRVYFLLKATNIIESRETKNKYLRLLKLDLQILKIKTSLIFRDFFRFFANNTKIYDKILLGFSRFCFLHIPSKTHKVIVLFMDVGSKIIVILVFLLDVFYFKQLNYFYKVIWLLLLPLILDLLKISCMQYYKDNIENLISYLDSQPIENTALYEFCYKPNIKFYEQDFCTYFYVTFNPVFEIPINLAYRYDIRQDYHVTHINLIICVLYVIGWSYVWLIGMGYLT